MAASKLLLFAARRALLLIKFWLLLWLYVSGSDKDYFVDSLAVRADLSGFVKKTKFERAG